MMQGDEWNQRDSYNYKGGSGDYRSQNNGYYGQMDDEDYMDVSGSGYPPASVGSGNRGYDVYNPGTPKKNRKGMAYYK